MLSAETVQICCCGAAVLLADLDAPMIAAQSIISSLLLAPRLTASGSPSMFATEILALYYRGAPLHLALRTASVGDAVSTTHSVLATTFLKTGVAPSMQCAHSPSLCWRGAAPPSSIYASDSSSASLCPISPPSSWSPAVSPLSSPWRAQCEPPSFSPCVWAA